MSEQAMVPEVAVRPPEERMMALESQVTNWADIDEAGGVEGWIDAELRRLDLVDEVTDTSSMSDKERKRFKVRRDEERRVRRLLRKQAWTAYRGAHLIHLGRGVFHHDVADVDRYDVEDPLQRLQDNDLPILKDVHELAAALLLTIPRLRWLSFHREVDSGTNYHRWLVPKRSGGQRLISAPKPDLKAAQRWIARRITEHLPVHGAAHGFLAGRSTVTNAEIHAGASVVVKFDLKDFYPSITLTRVKGVFRKAGYGEQVATVLALLCTEAPREELPLRGRTYYVATGPRSLPQGAPTSPSITNTICMRLDRRLAGLARTLGCAYTRYADDLTFSWPPGSPPRVGRLSGAVERIVAAENFEVHPGKTRILRSGRRQKITGLVVNSAEAGRARARVPRAVVRRLRAAIHNRRHRRSDGFETLQQLRGLAAYVHMTDPEKGRTFMAHLDALDRGEEER